MPFSRGSFWPRNWTHVSCIFCIAGGFFPSEPPRKPNITWMWSYLNLIAVLQSTHLLEPRKGFPGASDGKESVCNMGDLASVLGWEDPLEEGMATHSSILAWKTPMDRGAWWATVQGLQRVRPDSPTKYTHREPKKIIRLDNWGHMDSQSGNRKLKQPFLRDQSLSIGKSHITVSWHLNIPRITTKRWGNIL